MRSFLVMLIMSLCATLAPGAEALPPDIVVAADGSGQFKSVNEAVQSIAKESTERIIILIKNGTYAEKVRIDAACITLRGQSREKTRIEFSLLHEDFQKNPDDIGRAVVNINGDDCVLENLTIENTAGIVGPHAFGIYGKGDRTVIVDSDVLSDGADTVSLWRGDTGRYYHARCRFRGAVDFVCPRGWCFIRDSSFYETKATAALWHDGSKNRDQKLVLRNCTFDGVEGWNLARHHHDAQFFWIGCTFSTTMNDKSPFRVIYPIGDKPITEAEIARNKELEKTNRWGKRYYFQDCHREGAPDFPWHADNLASALGSPRPEDITPAWTFAGEWDPEAKTGPKIVKVEAQADVVQVTFDEPVTVKGKPVLTLAQGDAVYASGSGTDKLRFPVNFAIDRDAPVEAKAIRLHGGAIIASRAAATLRHAELMLPTP